ncbi:MAG: tetratricopeptide repeat protein [bacterium]
MFEQIEKLILQCKYGRALALVKKALKAAHDKNVLYRYLVWIYRMKGDAGKALYFSRHLEKSADTLCEKAILYRMKCDFEKARKEISSAGSIFRKQKDKEGLSFVFWVRGGIERYGGRPRTGYGFFARALRTSKSCQGRGYALCGLGGTGRLLGKFDESLENYREANRIFKNEKDRFGAAYSSCGLGSALRMKNDFRKAKEFYKKAVSLYEKIGDEWNRAYSMWGDAQAEWFLENEKDAKSINSAALKIFSKFKDPRGKFYCYIQAANFERMSGNFSAAEKFYLKCSKILKTLPLLYEQKLLGIQKKLIRKKVLSSVLIP